MAPIEAEATPLPTPDITPPTTKIYFILPFYTHPQKTKKSPKKQKKNKGYHPPSPKNYSPWQVGQKEEVRPPILTATMGVEHRRHGVEASP